MDSRKPQSSSTAASDAALEATHAAPLGTGPLEPDHGYQSAVAEETRSHDDVIERPRELIDHRFNRLCAQTIAAQYRDLVRDCALMAPDFREFESGDLPELTADDLALIQRAKGLIETDTLKDAQQALLEDVIAECEFQNERRAEARDQEAFERYHGGDSAFNDRERLEDVYGIKRLF